MKIAIVGASRIAQRTLEAWSSCKDVRIAGVLSRSEAHGRHIADRNSLPYLGSPDSAGNSELSAFDAVYITSNNSRHAPDMIRFLEAGKHVLIEKPLALTHSDAESAATLAEKKGLILQEGMMHRFHPELIAFKNTILSGELGQLREVDLNFSFCLETHGRQRRTKKGGGGAMADLGCYLIDFLTWTFGTWTSSNITTRCIAELDSNGEKIDATTQTAFKLNDQLDVRLACSISSPSINIWEARGTLGAASIERNTPQEHRAFKITRVNEDSLLTRDLLNQKIEDSRLEADNLFLFREEFLNFTEAVSGKSNPMISVQDSIQNARLLEQFIKETESSL